MSDDEIGDDGLQALRAALGLGIASDLPDEHDELPADAIDGNDEEVHEPVIAAAEVQPPPQAIEDVRPRAKREPRPDITVVLPGGSLCYYESKNCIQAVCGNTFHDSWVLTRTCSAAAKMQGAPVGFLTAFLEASGGPIDKAGHWALIPEILLDLEWRRAARDRCIACINGRQLVLKEHVVGTLPNGPDEPVSERP